MGRAHLKYEESREKSLEILRQALPLMSRQPAGFYPPSYAVWYEHLAGINPPLSMALSRRLAAGPLLDHDVLDLHHLYIEVREERAHKRLFSALSTALSDVARSAQAAGRDAGTFCDSLEARQVALQAARDPKALEGLVVALLEDTRGMASVVREFARGLTERSAEISLLQERLRQVESDAFIDPLTELRNRRGFEQDVLAATQSRNSLAGCALLFVDIDHFKRINDQYGHLLGDKVLRAVSDVIRFSIKGRDIAARLGGEEFAVLLPDTVLAGATALAEQLRVAMEKGRVRRAEGEPIGNVTISIGVALGRTEETLEALLSRADAALYAAKHAGRNRVHIDKT